MKYFRIFNNHSDYEKFRESDDYIVTNVSVCLEEGDVHISEPKSEDYSDKYLTFVAVEPSTFSFTSNEIEYSLDDGSTWSTLVVGSSTEEVGAGEKINFRANITSAGTEDVGIGTFSSTGKFDVEGNIMSLIYGDDFIDKTTAKTRNFERMFYQNENIINAENLVLPVEQIPSYCYREMFDSCTNLESAPILSATTLEQYCYSSMFRGCTKLENIQEELPSTELPTCCYVKMYAGCSSLKETPKIKGIHASWNSCESMFSACTSLSAVTEFDVETTTKLTCSEMFEGCTSLTIVPDLKIKTITGQTSGSLNAMFKNCTSLVNAPKIPSDLSITSPVGGTNVSGEFKQMFMGCTSLKTAPDLPNTRLSDGGYQSMFAGCTSLENAPILPSTALASACYEGMFSGCTSLTTAPSLPSTTLANNCYNSMFRDCTSLTTAPSLPSTTLAEGVYQSMFEGCTSLAIAPELPATTLYNDCYRAMFTGCTSLTVAPVLSAQTLVGNCYRYMFGGCNKLNYIEALFTNTPSTSYNYNWVNGVARSGTFVMSGNAEWDTGTTACGVHTYPCGWIVTTHASVHVTGVTLDTTASTINKGATTTLVATVSPNDATDKSVSWSTSDASIATVDSSGAVSGIGCGNAVITVTTVDGGYTAQCSVSVSDSPYTELEYIESTSNGGQYIDLDINLYETLNTWYDIAIKYNVSGVGKDNTQPTLFGCQNTTSPWPGTFIRMNTTSSTNTIGRYIGGSNKDNNLGNNGTDIELPVQTAPNKNVTSLNNGGQTHTWGTSLFCAFNSQDKTQVNRFIAAKLYYFKLFLKADESSQGTLVRDMMPCKRKSDNKVGLLDKVNNVFYVSPNDAEFVAGPEVNS